MLKQILFNMKANKALGLKKYFHLHCQLIAPEEKQILCSSWKHSIAQPSSWMKNMLAIANLVRFLFSFQTANTLCNAENIFTQTLPIHVGTEAIHVTITTSVYHIELSGLRAPISPPQNGICPEKSLTNSLEKSNLFSIPSIQEHPFCVGRDLLILLARLLA